MSMQRVRNVRMYVPWVLSLIIVGGLVTFVNSQTRETLTPPQEPVTSEEEPSEPQEPPSISIPETLSVGEHINAELSGISLDDVARGRVTLEIYPKGSVTVFSNISFVTRKPEIILFPRKPGDYWLVFVLHNERSYTFLDVPFTVTSQPGAAE